MTTQKTAFLFCSIILFLGATGSASGDVENGTALSTVDPVAASFHRELNHEPSPVAPAQGLSIEKDLLYREVNSVHWTSPRQTSHVPGACETGFTGNKSQADAAIDNAPAQFSENCERKASKTGEAGLGSVVER